jgi:hypothetical protein
VNTTKQMQRDLNPHKGAVAAMWIYHERYAKQALGSMGFWGSLKPYERDVCMDLLERLALAPDVPTKESPR